MELHYNTTGFLKDASYSADLLFVLREYEKKFEQNIDELVLELKELSYYQILDKKPEAIQLSEENKKCTIHLTFHKYYDKNGNETGVPSPIEVYRTIKFMLEKAANQINEMYDMSYPEIALHIKR